MNSNVHQDVTAGSSWSVSIFETTALVCFPITLLTIKATVPDFFTFSTFLEATLGKVVIYLSALEAACMDMSVGVRLAVMETYLGASKSRGVPLW